MAWRPNNRVTAFCVVWPLVPGYCKVAPVPIDVPQSRHILSLRQGIGGVFFRDEGPWYCQLRGLRLKAGSQRGSEVEVIRLSTKVIPKTGAGVGYPHDAGAHAGLLNRGRVVSKKGVRIVRFSEYDRALGNGLQQYSFPRRKKPESLFPD